MSKNPMYSTHAHDYSRAIQDNIFNARYERPSLFSLLGNIKGKKILDMGCGPGVYASNLTDRGGEVTAIDASPEMIAIVREKLGNRVKCYVQNIEEGIPKEKNDCFDMVIAPLVIHYLKDWSMLLSEIHRVLKEDGFFIFSTHHTFLDFKSSPSKNYFKTEQLEQQWDTIGKPVNVTFYRRPLSKIFSALREAGFLVDELSEGKVLPELKHENPEIFKLLTETPFFLFLRCKKLNR